MNQAQPTPYADINALLAQWQAGLLSALGEQVTGLYLWGSLSYGGFIPGRSDIDLQALLRRPLTAPQLDSLEALHQRLQEAYPRWRGRVECAYVPLAQLQSIEPPEQPRPWWGFDHLYREAGYGHEWLINQWLLHHFSITLFGPPYDSLAPEPALQEVRRASARDFYREWLGKLEDPQYLADSHQQSYLVLNLCRILYSVQGEGPGSKQAAADWTSVRYPQWAGLIAEAQDWEYGSSMDRTEDVCALIRFTDAQIQASGIMD
ncbi:DUF4111 domain-containing protein [bacterium]|nr:DUF4111 domain-containing protein [bacterium]